MKDLRQVYFRIDSPYEWEKGMSASLFPRFEKETKEILKKIGLTIIPDELKMISICSPEGVSGLENLYMHPMSFSGVLSLKRIEKAKKIIENYDSKLFSLRNVDVYELQEYSRDTIERNNEKQEKINSL